jgi:hypothetical protein
MRIVGCGSLVFRTVIGVAITLGGGAAWADTFPPNPDDEFTRQWALHNTGQEFGPAKCSTGTGGCSVAGDLLQSMIGTADADIDAPFAWDRETGDGSVLVAIIDTGAILAGGHGNLFPNLWVNEPEVPPVLGGTGVPGVDDDGNGYVDDLYGYDFCAVNPDPTGGPPNAPCTIGSAELPAEDTSPGDHPSLGHGTHLAGIVGALGNSTRGTNGVAWDVEILPIKAFHFAFGTGSGPPGTGTILGTCGSVVKAVDYAIANDADVILMGWVLADRGMAGGCHNGVSDLLQDALDRANTAGILVVAAAGDDGANINGVNNPTTQPGSYPLGNILTVGATTPNDEPATVATTTPYDNTSTTPPSGADGNFYETFDVPFASNFGTPVDVAAPGVAILSTLPRFGIGAPTILDRGYGAGTGQAAAFVAGAAALIWSVNPVLTSNTVKSLIAQKADLLTSLSGKTAGPAGKGRRLNVSNSLPDQCSDGFDNDGDGGVDYGTGPGNDIGCLGVFWAEEDPECQDGLDNEASPDGKIDFDGGASVNGGVPIAAADPECAGTPVDQSETPSGCGVGFELAFVLPPLIGALARARRRRASPAGGRPADCA